MVNQAPKLFGGIHRTKPAPPNPQNGRRITFGPQRARVKDFRMYDFIFRRPPNIRVTAATTEGSSQEIWRYWRRWMGMRGESRSVVFVRQVSSGYNDAGEFIVSAEENRMG